MKHIEPQKAVTGSVPPANIQPGQGVACYFPAKPKSPGAKPAISPPKPKPEPTLEQRVAEEVDRRVNDAVGNFAIGYLIGSALNDFFHGHEK